MDDEDFLSLVSEKRAENLPGALPKNTKPNP